MPERQGVGEGEAKGLYESALNAPSGLPRAGTAQPAAVPWPIKTSPTHTQNPNLLANKMPPVNTLEKMHIQPSKSSAK